MYNLERTPARAYDSPLLIKDLDNLDIYIGFNDRDNVVCQPIRDGRRFDVIDVFV